VRRAPAACAATAIAIAAWGCHGIEGTPARAPARPAAADPARTPTARYVLGRLDWTIQREGEIERGIASRHRFELSGDRLVGVAPREPLVDGGVAFPTWAGSGRFRFVFWSDRELYGAETFTGPLVRIATLRSSLREAGPWLDGIGIVSGAGFFVLDADSGVLERPSRPGLAYGVAIDARRAVVQSRLGETWWTSDAGASYRPVPRELGDVVAVTVIGADLALDLDGGVQRFIHPSGELTDARGSTGPPEDDSSGERSRDDGWPEDEYDLWSLLASSGVAIGPDQGFVVGAEHFALVDVASGEALSVGLLPDGRRDCEPFVASDVPLLVCRDELRGYVYDVGSDVRLERVFTRSPDERLDLFVGSSDGSIGFVGPCAGHEAAPRADGGPDATTGATPLNPSPANSRRFCVRDARGHWIEHELSAADAADVASWIPRSGGAAVAIVARRGTALPGESRVDKRGELRVVRVAREEPPLGLPQYPYNVASLIRRDLWVDASSAIHGWLASQGTPSGMAAVSISPDGFARKWPMPAGVTSLAARGRFALATDEQQALYQTTDGGRTWRAAPRPPGDPLAGPSQCTELGCSIGSFVRVGWGLEPDAEPPPPPNVDPRQFYGRQEPPTPPLTRLSCSFDGRPRSVRQSGDLGFGVSSIPVAQPRASGRVGILGSIEFPQSSGQPPLTGEVTASWLEPFDATGRITRETVDLAGLDLQHPPYRIQFGAVTTEGGGLRTMVIGSQYACPAALLERLEVIRPMSGCHSDPSVGVEVSGGVLFFSAEHGGLSVEGIGPRFGRGSAQIPHDPSSSGGRSSSGALSLLRRGWIGSLDRRLAAGYRDGVPVIVAVDAEGEAMAASFDPEARTLGPEVPLAPFSSVELGDAPGCRGADKGEARVTMTLSDEIGIAPGGLPGVVALGTGGFAALRWSPRRVCLDAVDIEIQDERWQQYLQRYVPHNASRRLVGRFAPGGGERAALVVVEPGAELVQPIRCSQVGP
jgi:hypothetical protein